MRKIVLPRTVCISPHAAEMYLQRIVDKPVTEKNFQAAILFLTEQLRNRAFPIVGKRVNAAGLRVKLAYKGLILIYSPGEKKVYTIYPDENSKESLEMCMCVPPDFIIAPGIRVSNKLKAKLFQKDWPVVSADIIPCRRIYTLIISTSYYLVSLDMEKRQIVEISFQFS